MSITQCVVGYLVLGGLWALGTHQYCKEPVQKSDFVMSMAFWPVEVFILLVSYVPMAWEEVQDKVDEWKAKYKK